MVVCFIDVALLIAGIVFLILLFSNGSIPFSGNKELRGGPGYFVATLLMLPLPITFLIACGMGVNAGVNAAQQGKQKPDVEIDKTTAALVEIVPLVLCVVTAGIIGAVGAKPKRRKKKKKRPVDDDYDDYDRPARRRRLDEEEEEEERAGGSRRRVDDDEDDVPRRRRRTDDDEDDYGPPRRRRRDDDD